jgi:hypothetical protein
MANEIFTVGDGATFSINGDSYPCTVRKVSSGGKMVWVSEDDFRNKPKVNDPYPTGGQTGVFIPLESDPKTWRKFTLRQDLTWRGVGGRHYFLNAGRSFKRDPSF